MLPVVTVIGIEFAFLNSGLVVTETGFNLPGVVRGEATLSCLGLGVPDPYPSWGRTRRSADG